MNEGNRQGLESSVPEPHAESPHARPPPPADLERARARVAAVLASWFPGSNVGDCTEYERWLMKRFAYWAKQLQGKVADPHGELLSALAFRLHALHSPPTQSYADRVFRNAMLDVVRKQRGRGAARGKTELRDQVEPQAPSMTGDDKYRLLKDLDELVEVERLPAKSAEALRFRVRGLSDLEASKQSKWPCTPATFRKRVQDARDRLKKDPQR
jgi:hypothetical protein